MSYVPNAETLTEPLASRSVESAALEFRTLKAFYTTFDARIDSLEEALASLGDVGGLAGVVYIQRVSGTGSQTAYTLNIAPTSLFKVDVYVQGIYQQHDTFSISGATLTFSEAPVAGSNNIEIQISVMQMLTPGSTGTGTVTSITAGAGLTGGTITTSGTIAIDLASANAWTANQNFNGANIGTFSTVPSVTTTGTVLGLANSTNAVLLSGSSFQTPGDAVVDLGATALRWNNFFLKNNFVWNNYTISAPVGGTTTFLRNDGTWAVPAGGGGGGTGTVTTLSVVSANGFTGTVANPTTTPAITLTTSLTGLLKGNGTAMSVAVADTDYVTPTGSVALTNKTLTNPTITNYTETVNAPAAGSAFTVDLTTGTIQKLTTNANTTITLPTSVAGKNYSIIVAFGGVHTLTWAGGTTIKWAGGTAPTPTSVSGKLDIFVFTCDGTNTYGRSGGSNF